MARWDRTIPMNVFLERTLGNAQTEEEVLDIFRNNYPMGISNVLGYVPDHLKTYAVCRSAINMAAINIINVPPRLSQERSLIYLAVLKHPRILRAIRDLVNSMSPEEKNIVFTHALMGEEGGNGLQFIPEHERTISLCKRAVQNNPAAIAYVPSKFKMEATMKKLSRTQNRLTRLPEEVLKHSASFGGRRRKHKSRKNKK